MQTRVVRAVVCVGSGVGTGLLIVEGGARALLLSAEGGTTRVCIATHVVVGVLG